MKIILSFFFLMVLICCTGKPKPDGYKYNLNLNQYLIDQHNLTISDEKDIWILIVPLESCTPCINEVLNFALSQKGNTNLKTVLLANGPKSYLKNDNQIKQLNPKIVYYDKEGSYTRYELGIFSPVILHYRNGKEKYFAEISMRNIDQVIMDFTKLTNPSK